MVSKRNNDMKTNSTFKYHRYYARNLWCTERTSKRKCSILSFRRDQDGLCDICFLNEVLKLPDL